MKGQNRIWRDTAGGAGHASGRLSISADGSAAEGDSSGGHFLLGISMIVRLALRALFAFVTTRLQTGLFVTVASMIHAAPVQSAALWDFIHVGQNFETAPRWDPRRGKADVQIRGSKIEIRAYYGPNAEREHKENVEPNVEITGTLTKDGSVFAKCVLLGTDAGPVKLIGRYITRTAEEIWGGRHKKVTYKELVFPRLPNAEFWGFITRDAADK